MKIRMGTALLGAVVLTAGLVLVPGGTAGATLPAGVYAKVTLSSTTLTITDASRGSDKDNYLGVKLKRDEGWAYVQDDAGMAIAGTGCQQGSFVEDTSHNRPEDTWSTGWDPWQVRCPMAKIKKLNINVGAGDDIVEVALSPVPVTIAGGAGSDDLEYDSISGDQSPPPYFSTSTINGGLGDDYLVGGRGSDKVIGDRGFDWVEGTCGTDNLQGGSDDDQIIAADALWGNMDCPYAKDTINCGDGVDGADVDPSDVTTMCEDVAGPY